MKMKNGVVLNDKERIERALNELFIKIKGDNNTNMLDIIENLRSSNLDVDYAGMLLYSIVRNSIITNEEFSELEKTISFLRSIGVKYIEDVLLYRRNFLLFNSYKVKKLFNDYALKEIVELINEDYTNVDLLFR